MAERRMFAKTIIDSDLFLDMPMSTQCLYFHLNMRADDDGFINNPKKIQRMIGCNDDDIKMLIAKQFIIPFESGIVVIKHWKIHNYIRGDRKKETIFKKEAQLLEKDENGAYELITCIEENKNIEMKKQSTSEVRKEAYEKSSLPYSFEYKIKKEFVGKECPICGCIMSYANNLVKPSIQHNIPISKGGGHELGNISVICLSCNTSMQDTETSCLNADEVIEIWDRINEKDNVRQVTGICQTSDKQVTYPGKVRLGKDRLEIEKEIYIEQPSPSASNSTKTSKEQKHKYGEFKHVLLTDKEKDKLLSELGEQKFNLVIKRLDEYIEETGKKYKNHNLTIRRWVIDAVTKENPQVIDISTNNNNDDGSFTLFDPSILS